MEDKLMKRAKQKYERFTAVRKNSNAEETRTAAIEAQVALDSVRSDQGAVLVGIGEFREHVGRLAADEVWLRAAEADIQAYLTAENATSA